MKKYLLYAIGEILLVVIGILLALQINTWNNNRIDRKLEREYAQRLAFELESEIDKYEQVQEDLINKSEGLSRIVEYWHTNQIEVYDSILFIRDFMSAGQINPWYRQPVAWTQLVQSGDLKLIKDQKLIDMIFTHYNSVKNASDNYASHPMDMTNEARKKMPALLLDENGNQFLSGQGKNSSKIPGPVVFSRIESSKQDLIELYATLVAISNINVLYLKSSINSANEIIKYIRLNYRMNSE